MNLRRILLLPSFNIALFSNVTLLLLFSFSLTGCVSNNGSLSVVDDHPILDYEVTGIPLIYFGFGTSTPITPELSLTVAHVAKVGYDKVVAYHPDCDLAIVESRNTLSYQPNLGLVFSNQGVETFGMSPSGKVLKGEGVYHRDLMLVETDYFKHCPASVMDAPVQDGMSGGGVCALVGIIAARAHPDKIRLLNGESHGLDRISIFVALNFVRDWLDDEVKQYYGDQPVALQWQTPQDLLIARDK